MKKLLRSLVIFLVIFSSGENLFSQSATLLKDINTGSAGSYPHDMIQWSAGKQLFFASSGSVIGLWVTDGTSGGTKLVRSLSSGDYYGLTKFNSQQAVFTAGYGLNDEEIWVTDGTAGGTFLLNSYNATAPITNMAAPEIGPVANGKVFFKVLIGSADLSDVWQLWCTDGTIAGTILLADSIDARYEERVAFSNAAALNNDLIFYAFNSKTSNYQVWRSDATKQGTYLLKNFGTTAFQLSNMTALNNHVLFTGFDNTHGGELWQTDGSVSGTGILKDLVAGSQSSSPVYMTLFKHKVFFITDGALKIWQTNGTKSGTQLVQDVDPQSQPSSISGISGGYLYFLAWDASNKSQLWRTSGGNSGSVQLTSDADGIFSIENIITDVSGTAYFIAVTLRNNSVGWSLYKTDGTSSGTIDVYDTPKNIFISDAVAGSGLLYFISSNSSNGENRTLYSYSSSTGIQPHDFFSNRDDDAYVLRVSGSSLFLSLNGTNVGDEPFIYSPSVMVNRNLATNNLNGDFLVYPNPGAGNFNIQMPSDLSDNDPVKVLMIDLSGRIVDEQDKYLSDQNIISLQIPSWIPNGTYMLKIVSENSSYEKAVELVR